MPDGPLAWRHVGTVDGLLDDGSAGVALETVAGLERAWAAYGFDGNVPEVDFGNEVVLLLIQPDDACPDELIGLEVRDGALRLEWIPPPGGCNQPLIMRLHAVAVHRGHLPRRFTVKLPEPYADSAFAAEVELPPYEGDAPPPRTPPPSMTEAEVAAVFDGHVIRRCTPDDEAAPPRPVNGLLSDDPDVAHAQEQRAFYGAASDEQTTRDVMADPRRDDDYYGFPLLPDEIAQEQRAENLLQQMIDHLVGLGLRPERDFVPMLGRHDGMRPHLLVPPPDVARWQAEMNREFGHGEITVDALEYDLDLIRQAQRALTPIMGGDGAGGMFSASGVPGPVKIDMIDPTRDALDRVAATVDPELVCVAPVLSGIRPSRL